ncbi:thiamine phosphate synthase [Sphingomonas sp. ABOLD]|uniref:Thiamine-phosphate synthase n=1 Tax=Sphingomonas trueperi TaxID=53317 RepID=A0A7X6BDP1_9SPHN|nr:MULTISPECIES: thiamine phosphate synthase [Sphingomonas]NJB97937.1 thiamine-phosphate pyrophosphorylase [Sphingomonas trueperi]RSV34215.1 thiamine phosphate synthase [Sphingomonas sp. ABOLE]RSV38829.1 thiamine phosphate synthase [Sphingomonas sp. ABOLD]
MSEPFDDLEDEANLEGFAEKFVRDDRRPPCQLYLISPLDVTGGFADRLRRALDAGPVAAFQFRVKDVDQHQAVKLAEPLQRICADAEVAFIVNDSVSLAKRLGADGVHLGQGDGDAREARVILGPNVQIGVTCHDSRHLAMEAGEAGADYVAFGAFYPTSTKATEHRPEPVILSWWSALFEIPCVAIGGITPVNAAPLVQAGADFLAVSHAVWGGDEAEAVRAFAAIQGMQG